MTSAIRIDRQLSCSWGEVRSTTCSKARYTCLAIAIIAAIGIALAGTLYATHIFTLHTFIVCTLISTPILIASLLSLTARPKQPVLPDEAAQLGIWGKFTTNGYNAQELYQILADASGRPIGLSGEQLSKIFKTYMETSETQENGLGAAEHFHKAFRLVDTNYEDFFVICDYCPAALPKILLHFQEEKSLKSVCEALIRLDGKRNGFLSFGP